MSCYTCTHCNKCGMFSIKVVVVCKSCGTEIPVERGRARHAGAPPLRRRSSSPPRLHPQIEFLDRVDELLARMDAKLRVNVFHVAFRRVLRDDQLVGNVPDRSAAREQSEPPPSHEPSTSPPKRASRMRDRKAHRVPPREHWPLQSLPQTRWGSALRPHADLSVRPPAAPASRASRRAPAR